MADLFKQTDLTPFAMLHTSTDIAELENMRTQLCELQRKLNTEREEFEQEKQELLSDIHLKECECKRQERLFEAQWMLLKKELTRLAYEKEAFVKERYRVGNRTRNVSADTITDQKCSILFSGIADSYSLKKRYHQLIKIFHPDNANGNTFILQLINKNYEQMKKMYEKHG